MLGRISLSVHPRFCIGIACVLAQPPRTLGWSTSVAELRPFYSTQTAFTKVPTLEQWLLMVLSPRKEWSDVISVKYGLGHRWLVGLRCIVFYNWFLTVWTCEPGTRASLESMGLPQFGPYPRTVRRGRKSGRRTPISARLLPRQAAVPLLTVPAVRSKAYSTDLGLSSSTHHHDGVTRRCSTW